MPASVSALRLFPRQRIRPDAVASPQSVTFTAGSPLVVAAKLALAADLTADPLTWVWTDITAYVRVEDRLRVLAAGFEQYVPKPVEPGELRAVVARLARRE